MKVEISKLAELLWANGITDDVLKEAILRGEAARDNATAFDPPARAGFDAWAEDVRALRELLVPAGWTASDERNLSRVVSPDGNIAIVVVAGDANTGLNELDRPPQPRHPRGDATLYALERAQRSLFPEKEMLRLQGPDLWFLLVYRVPGKDEVRAELSLAENMTDAGFIARWVYRHDLGTIALGPPPEPTEPSAASEINVEVRRKL